MKKNLKQDWQTLLYNSPYLECLDGDGWEVISKAIDKINEGWREKFIKIWKKQFGYDFITVNGKAISYFDFLQDLTK